MYRSYGFLTTDQFISIVVQWSRLICVTKCSEITKFVSITAWALPYFCVTNHLVADWLSSLVMACTRKCLAKGFSGPHFVCMCACVCVFWFFSLASLSFSFPVLAASKLASCSLPSWLPCGWKWHPCLPDQDCQSECSPIDYWENKELISRQYFHLCWSKLATSVINSLRLQKFEAV